MSSRRCVIRARHAPPGPVATLPPVCAPEPPRFPGPPPDCARTVPTTAASSKPRRKSDGNHYVEGIVRPPAGGSLGVPGTQRWEQMDPRTWTGPHRGTRTVEPAGRDGLPARTAWLRSAGFDGVLILGGPALALLAGTTILIEPSLFYPILVVDLWVLGYHHVIATFTRLCFDRASFEQRRWMIVHLVPIVAVVTAVVAWQIGIWIIVTIYFYWQWWHYTRQSWGISRAYRRADPTAAYEDGWLDKGVFYALPVYGVLLRSSEDHPHFIGMELWTFPVPEVLASTAGYAAGALVTIWAVRRLTAAIQGRLAAVHTLYMLTHFAIFGLAYIWTRDITLGWLMINIWHNLQYILFVWMFNNRRFRAGVDPQARLLSYISQSGRMWLYLLTCIAITGGIYWGVLRAVDWLLFAGLLSDDRAVPDRQLPPLHRGCADLDGTRARLADPARSKHTGPRGLNGRRGATRHDASSPRRGADRRRPRGAAGRRRRRLADQRRSADRGCGPACCRPPRSACSSCPCGWPVAVPH